MPALRRLVAGRHLSVGAQPVLHDKVELCNKTVLNQNGELRMPVPNMNEDLSSIYNST